MNSLKFLFLICSLNVSVFNSQSLVYDDFVYKDNIKTPMCYLEGDMLSAPYIELESGRLKVRFDDISDEIKDYYYTVIHCDYQWNPSDLDKLDYMTGFFENTITESEGSFNTQTDYIHYQFSFPNDMTGVSISGNYLMVVYEDGDEENVIISRRFVVYEQLVNIDTHLKEATNISDSRFRQEIDVKVFFPNYAIDNPYSDFHLTIMQNNRWDNAITNLQPRFVKSGELNYDYNEENVFDGGNEFREFNLSKLQMATNQVARTELTEGRWTAYLRTDPSRSYKHYITNKDINGNFYIVNKDGFEQHVEEEYVWVRFSLKQDYRSNTPIYIFGKMTDWQCKNEFLMKYNSENKVYTNTVLLKQGYYNYVYAIYDENQIDITSIEGTHFDTENEYTVIAYNTDFVAGYDRVVGVTKTNSFNR